MPLPMQWETYSKHQHLLTKGKIHCWFLPLSLEEELHSHAYSLLSDSQRDKYHRRRTPDQQQSYLCSRYYLLNLLGLYTNTPASDIKLSYSRLNKPYLSDANAQVQFNFTDTKNVKNHYYGIYAFCLNTPIGVDIESLHRTVNMTEIAQGRFSSQELTFIQSADASIDKTNFFAVWTRKEAFGKATGQGINFRMCERNLVGPQADLFSFQDNTNPWQVQQLRPHADFIGAIAYPSPKAFKLHCFNRPPVFNFTQ